MSVSLPDSLRWPAIRFVTQDEPFSAASHVGGQPLAPNGFTWPTYGGRPLDFLLKLDLATFAKLDPGLDLPKAGCLLFFYDTETQPWGFQPEDHGCSAVVYIEDIDATLPMVAPSGSHTFRRLGLTFEQIVTLPDAWSPRLDQLSLTAEDRFELNEIHEDSRNIDGQVGGHPSVIQNSMEAECEMASSGLQAGTPEAYQSPEGIQATANAHKWRLLAQVPSIEELDLMWGDSGMIYFWIKEDALQRRDFSQCWLVLQCH
ncbi:YwqG family protein [Mesorhizobium sp. ZC-5]|uniref:YwqG family protein n=1 Tax=Mesorhizobium sp. ZC-5 TaxID=2986066 RepID=UPI0021E8B92B|nr:YwqG family protein [Mesorhizobium sp. ZC-5]MCV3241668.1 YwqG family protein [Mesorhizobium sp. ZC-5]